MYTDYFGLSERPFQLTPDARFWFDSRTHKKAMAYLGYGLAQCEGFVVITGEIGAGKSTMVAHLMATIDRSRLNALSVVSTQVEGDDMLRLVAQGLGVPTAGAAKAALLDAVEQKLNEVVESGRRTLLVVDEAQNLSVSALEELRMLSNFQTGGCSLIQILLTGQPEFRDRLRSPGLEQLRQRVIATHHLQAMEPNEIEPYILHRLARAGGWSGRPGFDAGVFAAIYRHTNGVPRRINQLANRLLLHAAIERTDRIDAAAVEAVAADMSVDQAEPAVEAAPAPRAPAPEPVLPLRSTPRFTPVPQAANNLEPVPQAPPADPALEARIAQLEAQIEEQERAMRRVLTLLVDWVEGDGASPARRNSAA